MVHMQVPKDLVKVKIKTESAIIKGNVHTLVNGRLSDYMTSHVGKFIPVTDAEIFYTEKTRTDLEENGVKREVVFINVEKIEMIEYL
ncbi:MAG: hypothetical protein E3J58_00290 [Actinomycetota bacterium]|nr:MAG: hypothetical protein E3J58_00290 [Actinomycetota bacterium]